MSRLSSKLQRALIFLSELDVVGQHLVEVYAKGERIYFRVETGHRNFTQRCTLAELAALLQRPGSALKAEIREANQVVADPDLQARLELINSQKNSLAWVFRSI